MSQLQESIRWFGTADPITLMHIRQMGASGVVTALYDMPNGAVWHPADIERLKSKIEAAGLTWTTVESVPVHDDIKRRTGNYEAYIENYKACLRNLAASGIEVVTYNFMPVVDWTRTDLHYRLPDGGTSLRFDWDDFAAFDVHMLRRPDATESYSPEQLDRARQRYQKMDADACARLTENIIAGLPGGTTPGQDSLVAFQGALDGYRNVSADDLRKHLIEFLRAIVPVAEEVGIRLALHPDDPPFSLLGLPRVVSTLDDLRALFTAVPSPNNGLCFCSGSLGVRADNDLPVILKEFAHRTHFAHLRATKRDAHNNFHEADHLDGDVDMVALCKLLVEEQAHRDHAIPFRPDHGRRLLSDLHGASTPGYSAVGRLRGLAELRGVLRALRPVVSIG